MPELAKERKTTRIIAQVILFLAGIGSIWLGTKIGKV
jgi:hypothetical protein